MNKLKQGLCDKEECSGWIQYDSINQEYYCLDCGKRWSKSNFEMLAKDSDDDYKFRTEEDNLTDLNSL